ncbi:MAG: hypothetical protein CMH27_01820 [Micavibrio sp.]|nr:hypothetical protein [Micavibrio sp.]|tara:strand:- start:173 stop:427 length:255 start_codon:yes stop_codon:yes gene_type:complete
MNIKNTFNKQSFIKTANLLGMGIGAAAVATAAVAAAKSGFHPVTVTGMISGALAINYGYIGYKKSQDIQQQENSNNTPPPPGVE